MSDRIVVGCARFVTFALFAFLIGPILVMALMALSKADSLAWAPKLASTRWFRSVLTDSRVREVTLTSGKAALATGLISVAISVPAAVAVVRQTRRGLSRVAVALLLIPIATPGLLLAVGLIEMLTRMGFALSITAVVVGHVTLALPFTMLILASAARTLDPSIEEAARDLGAGVVRTFMTIVVSQLMPAIRAAFLIAVVVSFNEVVVASFLAGTDTTLPVYLFSEFAKIVTPAFNAIVTLVILTTAAILVVEYVFARGLARRDARV